MKTISIISTIVLLLLSLPGLHAQHSYGACFTVIDALRYQGCHFRLSAHVRTETENDSACARLYIGVKTPKGLGFYEDMRNSPIRSGKWQECSIEGVADSNAAYFTFGAMLQYNGRFYFDDFKLEVEKPKNHWATIFSDDFDERGHESEGELEHWKIFNERHYYAVVDSGEKSYNRRYLEITGTGIPIFGMDNEAGHYANVNGIKLYYEEYGDGQTLVLLHGNGASIAYFSNLIPYFLDKNYRVIAVDSRGHGRSTDTDAGLRYDTMASDVNELLNHLDLDSVYLLGHSDGAILGLLIALKYPDKIKKLIAFAPNIRTDTTAIEPPIYHFIEKMARTDENPQERKYFMLMYKYPDIPLSDLNTIGCDVLLMSGDRDFVPLTHMVEMFRNIPNSNLCIIPGATHDAPNEKTELFIQLATDFYEKPFIKPSWVDRVKAYEKMIEKK